jgi:hypothetical protein
MGVFSSQPLWPSSITAELSITSQCWFLNPNRPWILTGSWDYSLRYQAGISHIKVGDWLHLSFQNPSSPVRCAAHTCNPSTQEAKVGGFQVSGQCGLYSKTLSQKKLFFLVLCFPAWLTTALPASHSSRVERPRSPLHTIYLFIHSFRGYSRIQILWNLHSSRGDQESSYTHQYVL